MFSFCLLYLKFFFPLKGKAPVYQKGFGMWYHAYKSYDFGNWGRFEVSMSCVVRLRATWARQWDCTPKVTTTLFVVSPFPPGLREIVYEWGDGLWGRKMLFEISRPCFCKAALMAFFLGQGWACLRKKIFITASLAQGFLSWISECRLAGRKYFKGLF